MTDQDTRTRAPADEVPSKNFGMYETDYQVDYQDIFMEHFEKQLNWGFDADLYFTGLKDALAAYDSQVSSSASKESTSFNVIELGTGPGRCLRGLVADANTAGLHLSPANLIGIDRSAAQLRRAAMYGTDGPANVHWVQGDATNFAGLPGLTDLRNSVDYMVLFNGGSIFHLTEPGDPEAMFAQVVRLLRPGSGRAWVSLQNENILSRSLTMFKEDPDWMDELDGDVVLDSKAYPGVRYRMGKCSAQRTGRLIRKTQMFSVYRETADREELLTRNPVDITSLCWEEKDFVKCIEDAGLNVVKAVEGPWQTYYLIMLQ